MAEKILIIILGALLLFCTIQDFVKMKVQVWVIGMGGIVTLLYLPFAESIDIAGRIGGLAIGLTVILLSKVTAGKIGMGDGILLCITGIGLGFWRNLELFGLALFLAAILSIFLLFMKRVDRKQSIPFIPFLFIGYLILLVASKGAII
jgi:leader peptidase (prepilin peptidase)/N-methyltransferase